jgi:stage II sporulation protein AA (anti-sigma F factor antagonist)
MEVVSEVNMKTQIDKAVLTVSLQGELDHHNALMWREKLDGVFDRSGCRHLIFDLANVSFMDSSGIGMIIGRYKSAQEKGGKVALAGLNDQLKRLYDISGLQKIVAHYATAKEAGQALEVL